MPALAMTTSKKVMPYSRCNVATASLASEVEELSILTRMRRLPDPLGRSLRDLLLEDVGSRTAAITVV